VRKFIPEFSGGDREMVTVQHLLTHTSGPADMLPENTELRSGTRRSMISWRGREEPLLFGRQRRWSYQSMGILLARRSRNASRARRFASTCAPRFLGRWMGKNRRVGGRRIADTRNASDEKEDWH